MFLTSYSTIKGDILIKLNEMNSEQFSLVDANKLLHKSKDLKLNLIVKRSSHSFEFDEFLNGENNPIGETFAVEPQQIETVSQEITNEATDSPKQQQFNQIKPELCQNTVKFYHTPSLSQHMNLRSVTFARENGIGIRLAGGNRVGIFICDVQYNSPAERAGISHSNYAKFLY